MNKTKVSMFNRYLLMIEGDKKPNCYGYGYFIKIYDFKYRDNNNYAELYGTDDEICEFLDIDKEYYYDIMMKFKGIIYEEELYFRKIRHAKKALKWFEKNFESLLIMKKLAGH